MNENKIKQKLIEYFGTNSHFVLELYEEYLKDPKSINRNWSDFFNSFQNNGSQANYTDDMNDILTNQRISEPNFNKAQISDKNALQSDIYNIQGEAIPIKGNSEKLLHNMENSLTIPTATTFRNITAKLLEENRRLINSKLELMRGKKVSFTHIISYAILKALKKYPTLNFSFAYIQRQPYIVKKDKINLGIAIDLIKKNGTRFLMVPNIKNADDLNFAEFVDAYDELINRTRKGDIIPDDFFNTTITITNPGMLGTVASVPRLMINQGCIIAVGNIEYPAEFKGIEDKNLSMMGISKTFTITNTYDHRIIQGAESGEFLREVEKLILGEENFYEKLFEDLGISHKPLHWKSSNISFLQSHSDNTSLMIKQSRLIQLINMYRVRGHLIADINPLFKNNFYYEELDPENYGLDIWDYDRTFYAVNIGGIEKATLREILEILSETYCEKIGVEYMHIQNFNERSWLQNRMESTRNKIILDDNWKKRILWKLSTAELFERFLHSNYVGHKRFSLEGLESLIPALDYLINISGEKDVDEICIGMAHRGRLNVLANIIGKPFDEIFAEFEENFDPDSTQGTGDVKYHLGASGDFQTISGKKVHVSVAYNPSHLEFVDPVLMGTVRAKQKIYKDYNREKIIPVLIHGDAAFAGQGIVMETLNLSQLDGYTVGGTIHIILNNQIGFTTNPENARSSPYATDVAKAIQAPIFHVNAEEPEAVLNAVKLAFEYRNLFKKDVVIDIIGYRKHGHNEGDEPSLTQPLMYKKIKSKLSVKEIYAQRLINDKVIDEVEKELIDSEVIKCHNLSFSKQKELKSKFIQDKVFPYSKEFIKQIKANRNIEVQELYDILEALTLVPNDFSTHPKLLKLLENRRALIGKADLKAVDWATAEALAFALLLNKGISIRLSGQDSARGTFNQRHMKWFDFNNQKEFSVLSQFENEFTKAEVIDSLLSEAGVLGYEFGYSLTDPLTLNIWEAQFGDFANVAQVLIDNFIVSSFEKWGISSGITLFLPHGYEGQGPEHSSARIERFLTLCSGDNMRVVIPTTPAQFFALLINQALEINPKPLIVFTPKSLLRHRLVKSSLRELAEINFKEIIDDELLDDKQTVKTIILTSGKIYYELLEEREKQKKKDFAIVRIEQYYPFNFSSIKEILSGYSNAKRIRWVQEEPQNMGAWPYLISSVWNQINISIKLEFVGREESSSPAPGKMKVHEVTQREIIERALY